MNKTQVHNALETVLQELLNYHKIGEASDRYNPINNPAIRDTPRRWADMLIELTSGYATKNGEKILDVTFEDPFIQNYGGMVIVKDIEFASLCEHHVAPFIGKAHIGYIPNGKVVGLSKLPRLVEIYAHRLQVQERMNQQIVDDIMKYLQPDGAICVIEAVHTCMCIRGAKAIGSSTTTSVVSGAFFKNPPARAEFLQLLMKG